MSGSQMLSEQEKQEMIEDGKDVLRGKVFNAAKMLTQQGNIDDYIDFLSQNIGLVSWSPTRRKTNNFKL